jgi:hypothetical protein
MSQIRLYLDEDAGQRSVVEALRNLKIDVITTWEAKNIQLSDPDQLVWITQQGRVIYTFNVGDFCRLHKSYMTRSFSHTGIIVAAKQRYSVGEQVKAIANLIATRSAEDIKNQLVFLGDYLE